MKNTLIIGCLLISQMLLSQDCSKVNKKREMRLQTDINILASNYMEGREPVKNHGLVHSSYKKHPSPAQHLCPL